MEIAAAAGGVPALVDVPHTAPGAESASGVFCCGMIPAGGGRDGCLQHKEEVKDV